MTKNIFVSIIGRPNVGKSSLLNRLVGEKIAIVTDKPQTTRNRITGVLTENDIQYVFVDTPGVHTPRNKLGSFMVNQAGSAISGMDAIIFVTECERKITESEKNLIEAIKGASVPALLVINKIDSVKDKEVILEKIAAFSELFNFSAIVPLSALKGEGIDILMSELMPFCTEGPHMFPSDTLTDIPERAIVSETIREKLLLNMRDEIPHGIAVVIEEMKDRENGAMIDITATIICERESHKGMVIGKQGAMLKKIASEARRDIETFLDVKVNLQCWVKIREGWRDSDVQLKNFGYREN